MPISDVLDPIAGDRDVLRAYLVADVVLEHARVHVHAKERAHWPAERVHEGHEAHVLAQVVVEFVGGIV